MQNDDFSTKRAPIYLYLIVTVESNYSTRNPKYATNKS